jgi:hypothetical protein
MLSQHQRQASLFAGMQLKYLRTARSESMRVANTMAVSIREETIQDYFEEMINDYSETIESYEKSVEVGTALSFVEADWNFNTASKEWQNSKLNIMLKVKSMQTPL